MCGICGFTGPGDRRLLERMNQTLVHRGPDDEGYYQDGLISLAMRRLAIVDLDSGRQPMTNEDETIWVVFNGEIYNHQELRQDLIRLGHRFRSDHADTETVVHLYEEFGELWPELGQANGMFGLAIWDSERHRLLLYRDRIGKKPLYWALSGDNIVFGSEIKAVLAHPAVSRELDFEALYHYFSLKNTSAPATAFRQVKQLLPGGYLVWEDGRIRLGRYWRLDFSRPLEDIRAEEAARELLKVLDDAVYKRMQCDVPFGAYLSGGVDSSSVATLMRRHHTRPVMTFCLGYAEEPSGQFQGKAKDVEAARWMANRLASDHHEYIMTAQEFADRLPDVLRSFDEPFSGTVTTFFLSILIAKHVKVALSGDGADELFGSYLAHRLAWPMYHLLSRPGLKEKEFGALNLEEKRLLAPFATEAQFAFLKKIASPNQAAWRMRLAVFDEEEKKRLLAPEFLKAAKGANTFAFYQDLVKEGTALDPLNAVLEVEQKELLANQVLPFMDRLSMAHSIELRSPYLDYRLIELANRLPGRLKIKDGVTKYVHKLAMRQLIPKELTERPKEGFVQPIYDWMRHRLKAWVEATLSPWRLARHGLIQPERVKEILAEHYSGQADHSAQLWNLICFQVWYEEVLEKGSRLG